MDHALNAIDRRSVSSWSVICTVIPLSSVLGRTSYLRWYVAMATAFGETVLNADFFRLSNNRITKLGVQHEGREGGGGVYFLTKPATTANSNHIDARRFLRRVRVAVGKLEFVRLRSTERHPNALRYTLNREALWSHRKIVLSVRVVSVLCS